MPNVIRIRHMCSGRTRCHAVVQNYCVFVVTSPFCGQSLQANSDSGLNKVAVST